MIKLEFHGESPHPDLPAWSYTESDEHNGKRMRHVRRIKVFQFDRIVEYVEDIGKKNGVGFIIPGGIRTESGHYVSLHTVGELQDIAAEFKLHTKLAAITSNVSDLHGLYHDEMERRSNIRKGRKLYGRSIRRD